MFQEKDFSNGRVFNKRAFFLATLASSFTSGDVFKNIEALYESPSHDPRRTCIRLRSCDPDHGVYLILSSIMALTLSKALFRSIFTYASFLCSLRIHLSHSPASHLPNQTSASNHSLTRQLHRHHNLLTRLVPHITPPCHLPPFLQPSSSPSTPTRPRSLLSTNALFF